jgi:hypothetical protein
VSLVRQLPLWVRYVITIGVAAIIFAALVIYVHHHQAQSEGVPASPNKAQAAQEQKEDEVVVQQQQAPHVVKLAAGTAPAAAASAAIHSYMSREVSRGLISGPVDGHASCTAAGGSATRRVFSCTIRAGAKVTRLKYPFAAVVQPSAAKVTYCQKVTPPYPLTEVPLSAACR